MGSCGLSDCTTSVPTVIPQSPNDQGSSKAAGRTNSCGQDPAPRARLRPPEPKGSSLPLSVWVPTARRSKAQQAEDNLEARRSTTHTHLAVGASTGPVSRTRPAGTAGLKGPPIGRHERAPPPDGPRPPPARQALRAHVQLQRRFRPLCCVVLRDLGQGDRLVAPGSVTCIEPRPRLRRRQQWRGVGWRGGRGGRC